MHPDLDATLCARWPLIFAQRHGDPATTAMCYGFACGDGWFGLIDGLCEALQWETDHDGAPQVVARQVKSKLGSLRFHAIGMNEKQRGMIAAAKSISLRVPDAGTP